MNQHDIEPKEEKFNLSERKLRAWFYIGISVISTVFFFVGFMNEPSSSIADRFWNGLFTAFGLFILLYLVGTLIFIVLKVSLEHASTSKNPFMQVFKFVSLFAICLGLIDMVLLQGTYLVGPLLTFVEQGNFKGTYWNCDGTWRYVDYGEGRAEAYCDTQSY